MLDSKIIIRKPSAIEEFEYLWKIIEEAKFYTDNNYAVSLPDVPAFQTLFINVTRNTSAFSRADKDKFYKLFSDSVYDPGFYDLGIITLEARKDTIKTAVSRFLTLNLSWGFRIFPVYNLVFTRYGPQGEYDEETGEIILRLEKDGAFLHIDVAETPIHEVFHIGIDDCIVKKYHLSHEEKEIIVDLCIRILCGDLLPNYQLQLFENPYLDQIITAQSIKNLPEAIENYIQKYPRN